MITFNKNADGSVMLTFEPASLPVLIVSGNTAHRLSLDGFEPVPIQAPCAVFARAAARQNYAADLLLCAAQVPCRERSH